MSKTKLDEISKSHRLESFREQSATRSTSTISQNDDSSISSVSTCNSMTVPSVTTSTTVSSLSSPQLNHVKDQESHNNMSSSNIKPHDQQARASVQPTKFANFYQDDETTIKNILDKITTKPRENHRHSQNSTSNTRSRSSDIYPSLKLTLSDTSIQSQNRLRAGSYPYPHIQTLSSSDSSSYPSCHANIQPHSSLSPAKRRKINLSLSIPPTSPQILPTIKQKSKQAIPAARKLICQKSIQAQNAFKAQNAILQTKVQSLMDKQRHVRRQRRSELKKSRRKSSIIVIPSNHKFKLLWDVLTILITFASAFKLHEYIRDRSIYEYDAFLVFTNIWFGVDLLLNFITDHRSSDGTVMRTGREVWGRYLTTWFAVDALSLLPWERMFIRPIIIMQNRRNILTKWIFRSKGVVKVTRFLGKRKYFIKYFGKISKETKKLGVGTNRLVRLIIKYLPKYLLFYRNMKGVLLLKTLRQVHYLRKLSRGLKSSFVKELDDDIDVDIEDDEFYEEDGMEEFGCLRSAVVQDNEFLRNDDDCSPIRFIRSLDIGTLPSDDEMDDGDMDYLEVDDATMDNLIFLPNEGVINLREISPDI